VIATPPLADLPALPLHTAGKYVAAAYVVAFALVLIYMAIMAVRLSHIERELGELLSAAEADPVQEDPGPADAEAPTGRTESTVA
jgi:CcmD family protein